MKYVVTLAGRAVAVDVSGDRVTVDGAALEARLAPVPGTPLYHLSVAGQTHAVAVERAEPGRWHLSVDGERLDVEALDERTHAIRQLSGAKRARGADGTVSAPMPGLVVRVLVGAGDRVAAGQGLVVLEAMKMENELQATAPATVRSILVEAGAAVEKGTPLVELEEPSESG
jgi:pyruvate carboxylase subunit B